MAEATNLGFSVSHNGTPKRDSRFSTLFTFDKLVDWIKRQELDDYTTKGLIDLAATYPTAALPSFKKKFFLMVQRVRDKRNKEQGGTEYAKSSNKEEVAEQTQEIETFDEE